MENIFREKLQELSKEFGFTKEELFLLERYTDECLDGARASVAGILKMSGITLFHRFLLCCQASPHGLREDYAHKDVYWQLNIWYNFTGIKDTFYFRSLDDLDVFLGKIRNKTDVIELDSGVILWARSIAKMEFYVTEEVSNYKDTPYFFVQVVDKV